MAANLKVLLADDDQDDRLFFKDALDELAVSADLVTVNNGVQLMAFLQHQGGEKPDILFLDLNMPLKNGFDCLTEIKQTAALKNLPVIIFSTSFDEAVVDVLYEKGAHSYIQKPVEFSDLKDSIHSAIDSIPSRPKGREDFVFRKKT